jgi:dihydroorotase
MKTKKALTLTKPDDWHVHLRSGEMLSKVLGDTATNFNRAIVMPNLSPPIKTTADAVLYRQEIETALIENSDFIPLMTCYLTDETDPDDLITGFKTGVFTAAKLYPAGATTNSDSGVTNVLLLDSVFSAMSDAGMPLLIHGEVVDHEIDIFDREHKFIELVLEPLRNRHPNLKIVFEHITTRSAVEYVKSGQPDKLAATITPHHLSVNRSDLFAGGVRPHLYCLPIPKKEHHRVALVEAACSGDKRFFLGTDSAPHLIEEKESACGCAGIYNSPNALQTYIAIFEQNNALDKLNSFAALNGPEFYNLQVNTEEVCFIKGANPTSFDDVCVGDSRIKTFAPPFPLFWTVR